MARPGTSPYVGLYWHKNHGRWLVERHVHVGEFDTHEEALAAYVARFGEPPRRRRPRVLPVAVQPLAYRDDAPAPVALP